MKTLSMILLIFQELVTAKDPPGTYLNKLKVYLDPTASKSSKVMANKL